MAETSTRSPRKPYTVRVTPEIAERLDLLADAERRSASQMLEVLLVEALNIRRAREQAGDIHFR